MTFGRSPLLQQNYKILQKFGKNYHSEFERTWFNMKKDLICLDNLFFMAYILTRQRGEICLKSISIAVNHCVMLLQGVAWM